jgi:hypothetical protein
MAYDNVNEVIAREGCRAISGLASGDEINSRELGRFGACKIVINALIVRRFEPNAWENHESHFGK